jgi:23S rRNA pseudouridine1911/1915/1917 synthase
VFAALTQDAMDAMLSQQAGGLFVKEYEAIVSGERHELPGFPPPPPLFSRGNFFDSGLIVESGFRCYGPGRKSVRPVYSGRIYKTEVLDTELAEQAAAPSSDLLRRVSLRITRGFRHQIRCHLAWLGFPILGDSLYGGAANSAPLALRAVRLAFADPLTGEPKTVSLPLLTKDPLIDAERDTDNSRKCGCNL